MGHTKSHTCQLYTKIAQARNNFLTKLIGRPKRQGLSRAVRA